MSLKVKMTCKYIWTNNLSKIYKGCALVGTRTLNANNNKSNNHNLRHLYSMFTNQHNCVVYDLVYIILELFEILAKVQLYLSLS